MSADALSEMATLLGDRLSRNEAILEHHSHGEGWDVARKPLAVCMAETTEEVSRLLAICSAHAVPVVAFGAGSSLEGQVVPPKGGVCLNLTRMNRILAVSQEDLDCRVEAGVTRRQLEDRLQPDGLFFPVDPGADATVGGMVATGASGTTTVRYGAMRENVLGLTVVLADGSVARTGGRARKSSAGYDLTRLMIGSEGTLGVVTEVQLRLRGIPEAVLTTVCAFDTVGGAVDSVIEAVQIGLPLARSELVDEVQMRGFALHSGLDDIALRPTLFLEYHGTDASVAEQAAQMEEICRAHGGGAFRHARRPEDRNRLWRARHDAYYAAIALAPGKRGMVTDACVPISRLTECIEATQRDIEEHGLVAPIVGHVGDGNFHSVVMCDPADADEVAAGKAFVRRLAERALELGGTCTGEHGVGAGKIDFMEQEHGDAVQVMRRLKNALDPAGILNPGKVLRA